MTKEEAIAKANEIDIESDAKINQLITDAFDANPSQIPPEVKDSILSALATAQAAMDQSKATMDQLAALLATPPNP